MITTTDEKALQVLKEVVSERPDYVYSSPDYMTDERQDAMKPWGEAYEMATGETI